MRSFFIIIVLILGYDSIPGQRKAPACFSKILDELSVINRLRNDYAAALTSGAPPLQLERCRRLFLNRTVDAIKIYSEKSPCGGDQGLRDSLLVYLGTSYACANEDFVSISDMKEISEVSFDAMESYLAARDNAYKALQNSAVSLNHAIERFAATHQIEIEKTPSKNSVSSSFTRYNAVYTVFFYSYKQEAYLLEAIAQEDIAGVEQNRKALLSSSIQGLLVLRDLEQTGSSSLDDACRRLLEFYHQEADELKPMAGYLSEAENFERSGSAFTSNRSTLQTPESTSAFCKSFVDLGKMSTELSESLRELSARRAMLIDAWQQSCSHYLAAIKP
jgi:hypothetical protein